MTLFRSTRLFAASFCFLAFLSAPSLAQEADRPEAAAAPEQAPTVATPETKTPTAEIPDISGRWQTGETKRSVQAIISKTETPEVFSIKIVAHHTGQLFFGTAQQKNADDAPPFSFSSNFSVTWNPMTSQFLCDQKLRKIAITLLGDGNRLKVETTVDEQSLKELSEQEQKQLQSVQEWAFNPAWIRSTAIFNGYDNIESKNLIIVASKEGLAAYNKSSGKWTKIKVDVSKCSMDPFSRSLISDSFFSIVIENRIHAFSAQSGKWDSLLIPPEQMGTVTPTHGNSSLTVRIGDKLYALSPTSGRWTSPDYPDANLDDDVSSRAISKSYVASATVRTPSSQKPLEMSELTTKISSSDLNAAEQANAIRISLKDQGISLEASRDHAETRDAWSALERTLNDAFDAKTKLERLRIQELRRRLDQSEALIEKRLAQKDQIVQRRAIELVQGEETQWTAVEVPAVRTSPAPSDPQQSDRNALNGPAKRVEMVLGLRLEALTEGDRLQLQKTRYRGGMRVTEVLTGFPQKQGVKSGDILVGLNKWETSNLENVLWIVEQIERDAQSSPQGSATVNIFLVRNGELFNTSMVTNPLKALGTSNSTALETDARPGTDSGDNEIWPFLDRIATVGEELIAARQAQTYTSKLYSKDVISKDEMDRVDLRLATARRRFENLTEECDSKLKDLEADLEAGRLDVEAHKESVTHFQTMFNNARGPYAPVIEEKRKLAQAEALVSRIEARLKAIRRAEEDLKKIKHDANLGDIVR